jgi:hypothetical protein
MNYTDLVDLSNPQALFTAFAFACCLISMIVGMRAKTLFSNGRLPQSAFLLVTLFVVVGFLSHHSFHYLKNLIEGFY